VKFPGGLTAATAAAVLWVATAVSGDMGAEAERVYLDLYGARAARVDKTPSTYDDRLFGRELFGAAKASADSPALRAVLCHKSFAYSVKDPGGHAEAISVMRWLITQDPSQRGRCLPSLRRAHEAWRRHSRGAERKDAMVGMVNVMLEEADMLAAGRSNTQTLVSASGLYDRALRLATAMGWSMANRQVIRKKLMLANRQVVTHRRIALAKSRLKSNPTDAVAAKEMIMMYVVDLDRPDQARRYTFLAGDGTLADRVHRTAFKPTALSAEQLYDLGVWYNKLSARASLESRWLSQLRAEAYLGQFLSRPDRGKQAASARAMLGKIRQELDKVPEGLIESKRAVHQPAMGISAMAGLGSP